MRRIVASAVALMTLSLFAFAQPPPTIEERLTALETGLATLDTRFGLERTRQPTIGGETGVALQGRVTELERSLQRLATDVQRAERLAETAARDAANAQQLARDVALRAR